MAVDAPIGLTIQGCMCVTTSALSSLCSNCGIPGVRVEFLVPVWFLAAERTFTGVPSILGIPTVEFLRYVDELSADCHKMRVVIAECMLASGTGTEFMVSNRAQFNQAIKAPCGSDRCACGGAQPSQAAGACP